MGEIIEGRKAPQFTLPAADGEAIRLRDYAGRNHVVLYFYPRDMTPGCTTEACDFRNLHDEFVRAGAVIFGVSTDSVASHEKFAAKHTLNFPLLSDTDAKVAMKYGVYKEKNRYGRKFMGIERTTFVIDKQGTIRKIYPRVKVKRHVDEVLEYVRSLG